jgi:SAM-dependent methyltransferase
MMTLDSKQRFSNRADDYARYRPGYPSAVLELLRRQCALTPASIVADIGSGTGLLTKLFLENGNVVYGVEPNAAMREAGEAFLKGYRRFHSINASAEATTLPDASVNLVAAGTAFHWFEVAGARAEFRRILKPGCWVAVVANARRKDTTPFQRQYDGLLRAFSPEYEQVRKTYPNDGRMKEFFQSLDYREASFHNEQLFDFAGLRGRLLSSSFAPKEGHPNHAPMLAELRRVFDENQQAGFVRFDYKSEVHFGQLRSAPV